MNPGRRRLCVALLAVSCGPSLVPSVGGGAGSGDTGAMSTGMASASDSDGGVQSTGAQATSTSAADTTAAGDSSTGEPWLVAPGQGVPELSCGREGEVFVYFDGVLPSDPVPECVPPAGIDETAFAVAVGEWDGQDGVHVFSGGFGDLPWGVWGPGKEPLEGSIEIRVSAPYVLDEAWIDASNSMGTLVGRIDLATCPAPLPEPCAR
ncbi:MAG: hypothetical protein AAF721_19135 [Myxococcota bacterium]